MPSASSGSLTSIATELPLVVDLDGTLLNGNTLHEGLLQLLRTTPHNAAMLPWWALWGRVELKRQIADRVNLDVEFLPYNSRLLVWLREVSMTRTLVLCTAADYRFAQAVADHLGIFSEVIATRSYNMKSAAKSLALVDRFGHRGFDYAGNDDVDLPVFAQARRAYVVNPTRALRQRSSEILNGEEAPQDITRFSPGAVLRSLRPYQWVKNLLVYVPLLATINIANLGAFIPATLAVTVFCLAASAGYLFNDLYDVPSDRRHSQKKFRKIPSGQMPLGVAAALIPALLIAAFLVAWQISFLFTAVILLYVAGTMLYTFRLKRVPLLDTLVLAGLYTIRILGGAAALNVVPSVWLLSFSMFFFLSLALAKRHSELVELRGELNQGYIPGREYQSADSVTLIGQGSASGYAAVLVLTLFINSDEVRQQYRHPEIIWLICPLVLYWVNKLWLNSARGQVRGDPIIWAFQNRVSRGIGVLCVALLLLARWLP